MKLENTARAQNFVGAEAGEVLQVLGIAAILKLAGEDTGGAFSLQEDRVARAAACASPA